jgi:O-antigen/teichoic acid export membrane protein
MLPPDTPNNQAPKPNQDSVEKSVLGGPDDTGSTSKPGDLAPAPLPATTTGLGRASLKKLALHGAAWTILGFGTTQACRLAGNLVLTRLLAPEAFGIMVLVEMVLAGIQMFSDFGIGAGVVRNRRGNDPEFLNTAWTLQVMRGAGLWLATCIAAIPISIIYEAPILMQLIPIAGLSALIGGFTSTSVLSLRRDVNLKPLVLWEISSQIFGLLCMISLAWYLRSVWALALGGIIRVVVAATTSQYLIPGRKPRFAWDRTAALELVNFGKWIFLSTALTFLIQWGDRSLLGLFMTKPMLGLFATATIWSRIAVEVLLRLNTQVMFPIYADLFNRGDPQLRKKLFKARLGLVIAFVPPMWALSLGGQWMIDLLYDPRYAEAGWMLQILAAGAIGAVISVPASSILLAVGDSKRHMILQAGRGLILIGCISAGVFLGGIQGMIVGVAASKIVDYPLLAWAIKRYGVWMPTLDLGTFLLSAIVILGGHAYFGNL